MMQALQLPNPLASKSQNTKEKSKEDSKKEEKVDIRSTWPQEKLEAWKNKDDSYTVKLARIYLNLREQFNKGE